MADIRSFIWGEKGVFGWLTDIVDLCQESGHQNNALDVRQHLQKSVIFEIAYQMSVKICIIGANAYAFSELGEFHEYK
ncbi:hypothetical protein [Gracilibacillus sp. YIM 98692]|uniref:hypothetical protein n=1 Tax=Gracilibacillus sp. YIM 98692 TaxID=2663532 RepID=UPI0013CF7CA6|nr:hypothetical protein [Gracilibacillus sp. YIM 98692]